MRIESIDVAALHIPFKVAFGHASANRAATQTIWVTAHAQGGSVGIGEGCPREYVTGESLATARAFIAAGSQEWRASIHDTATLSRWVTAHRADIDRHPSAWAAVELALLDLIGQTEGRTVESVLGLPNIAGSFRYTAVLGDAAPHAFAAQLAAYLRAGFRDFKIKLAGDLARDSAKVQLLRAAGLSPHAVRADANNLWSDADQAIAHVDALGFRFWALEEPLRAGDYAGMRQVSAALGVKIILDESLVRADQLDALDDDVARWIANVRVSKMGGLLRSLRFAGEAHRRGLPMIVGAHVGETSVLTRAGLTLANAMRDCVVAHEGAFGTHLLAHDVIECPIMFGRNGVLDTTACGTGIGPGLGLSMPRPGRCS
jgi:L-alanine-DL-glutamate epimerase-like enolase superfamily enzyme